MPRAEYCHVDGKLLGIDDAIQARDIARAAGKPDPDWRCIECKKPVRPHRSGGHAAGHFEHLHRNPDCPLSDPQR